MPRGVLRLADFPDKPPWERGTKFWCDSIYALLPGEASWRVAGSLPGLRAYGASIETERGLVCAGGADAAAHYDEVYLLRWQSGKLTVNTLPPLPAPCAYACGARLGSVVYLAGGVDNPRPTSTLRTARQAVAVRRFAGRREMKRISTRLFRTAAMRRNMASEWPS